MTINYRELYQSTTSSLLGYDKFYPANIGVNHRQLRNLVRVTEGDKIYYLNDTDIFVLDISTNRSTLLATIPFEACCLGVGHGWIAAGAQSKGHCVFIRLDAREGSLRCFGHDLDEVVIGRDIVNSINIQLLQDGPGAEPEPVALISNNDRTVTVYSLERSESLTTLRHEAPMNYALLSPDSTILAAVGDTDRTYFYKRRRAEPNDKHEEIWMYPDFNWQLMAAPRVPTGADVIDDHGFAIAFSPSGQLCAASSQSGIINVFDLSMLQDDGLDTEAAIICSFASSRPTLRGCVRSMAFAPGPWDLLAWAEDHQHIGVADVRQTFVRRQIMSLDREKAQSIIADDATPEIYRNLSTKEKQHLSRLRSVGNSSGTSAVFDALLAENRLATPQQRRLRRRDIRASQRSADLDARERSVDDALDITIGEVEHRPPQPYSVNYTSPPRFRPSHLADPGSADGEARLMAARENRSARQYQPRRRTSVVLSDPSGRSLIPPDSPRARISASPGRMTDDEDTPSMSTNDLTPSRGGVTSQPRTSDIPTSDAWHVIQNAIETARRTDESRRDSNSLERLDTALEDEQRFATQLELQLADERSLALDLRRQIDAQDQRIQQQQRELAALSESGATSLRVERRNLAHERDSGEQRSAELEEELRLATFRTLRLESARETLIENESQSAPQTSISSAQSSALPIVSTNARSFSRRSNPAIAVINNTEALRRQRAPQVENLERQFRRAEARVRTHSYSSELQPPRLPENPNSQPIAQMRANMAARAAPFRPARDSATAAREANLNNPMYYSFITPNALTPRQGSEPALDRAQAAISRTATLDRLRRSINSTSGSTSQQNLAVTEAVATMPGSATRSDRNRLGLTDRISASDQQMAQAMFRPDNPRAMDANGNWVQTGGMRRVIHDGAEYEEMELGTTGIGWSEDGSSL